MLCRHPALVQAFAAVAAEKPHIDGVVKITAFESVERTRTQKRRDKDKVDLMIFPAGACPATSRLYPAMICLVLIGACHRPCHGVPDSRSYSM